MPSPAIETLLILQARDTRRRDLEAQIATTPAEVAAVEAQIAAERAAIDRARDELRHLESDKKLLETEIGSAEAKLAKYRTQQLAVKKNDEYQALTREIEAMEASIGALEERELELLYSIDAAKERFDTAEATLQQNISGHQTRIATLREREQSLRAELATAQDEIAAARAPIADPLLRLYDRIAARQWPVIVPLQNGICGGSHLRVSSEVDSAARAASRMTAPADTPAALEQLVLSDQSGQILYWVGGQ